MVPKSTMEGVTAKFLFTGVMLTCINQDDLYEVGIIQCPKHDVDITITEFKGGVRTMECKLLWPKAHDLIFKVVNPETEGVRPYPPSGDDTDFGFVVDLEGPKLHVGKVTVETKSLVGKRLAVTAGTLYTHELTSKEFDLVTWTDSNDPGQIANRIGKIADIVGLNVVCGGEKDSGIAIVDNVTGRTLHFLPSLPDTGYVINIDNDCFRGFDPAGPPLSFPATATDFRFYYDVVSSQGGEKFDLLEVIPPGTAPEPSPGACVNGHLSITKSLGLSLCHP